MEYNNYICNRPAWDTRGGIGEVLFLFLPLNSVSSPGTLRCVFGRFIKEKKKDYLQGEKDSNFFA